MKQWFCNLHAMLVVAVVVGVAWLALRTPAEPLYQGKQLRVWLQRYSGTNQERPETDEAVRNIGTNAIPTFLKMLRAYDSPLTTKLLTWASKGRYLRIHYTNPSVLNGQAFMGFQALGPDAASAVPELIKILDQNFSESSANCTAKSLAAIGPGAKAAVPLLLRAATSTNVSDHSDAIWALGRIHADADNVVPVLIRALRSSTILDQLFAAIALGKFKGEARSAVPALLEALESPRPTIGSRAPILQTHLWQMEFREKAKQALRQIDPESYAHLVPSTGQPQSNSLDFLTLPRDEF